MLSILVDNEFSVLLVTPNDPTSEGLLERIRLSGLYDAMLYEGATVLDIEGLDELERQADFVGVAVKITEV